MIITTVTSRSFQQNASKAQKASRQGPVVITHRGRPTHVLLSFAAYQRIMGTGRSIVDALVMAGLSEIEVECPRIQGLAGPDDGADAQIEPVLNHTQFV